MDDQYQMTQDGTELTRSDLNDLGEVSGLAGDRVLADLLQFDRKSGVRSKAVMPYCAAPEGIDPNRYWDLFEPTGATDGSVFLLPFRALIGPSAVGVEGHRGIRSGLYVTGGAEYPKEKITLDPTSGNHRVDLIYARVEIDADQAPVTRYVKSASGTESAQSVSVKKATVVTLGVVKGTEAASPSRPSLPTDADPVFYIPLAYVWLEHPFIASTQIEKRQIEEVAPFLGVNHGRSGGCNAGPCSEVYRDGSVFHANDPWTEAKRPKAYIAPSMAGIVERWFGINLDDPPFSVAPGTTGLLLDASIDWRNRLFWTRVQGREYPTPSGLNLAWENSGGGASNLIPSSEEATANSMTIFESFGQSFHDDGGSNRARICFLTNVTFTPILTAGNILIYVDLGTGRLYLDVGATAMRGHIFWWIRATGQMRLGGA